MLKGKLSCLQTYRYLLEIKLLLLLKSKVNKQDFTCISESGSQSADTEVVEETSQGLY